MLETPPLTPPNLRFAGIAAPTPTREGLATAYAGLHARLDAGDVAGALAQWDTMRREIETWSALTHLRYDQDTAGRRCPRGGGNMPMR